MVYDCCSLCPLTCHSVCCPLVQGSPLTASLVLLASIITPTTLRLHMDFCLPLNTSQAEVTCAACFERACNGSTAAPAGVHNEAPWQPACKCPEQPFMNQCSMGEDMVNAAALSQ
jgi:hypothetical protein